MRSAASLLTSPAPSRACRRAAGFSGGQTGCGRADERVLSLRHNFSAYDASYVALAELLDAEIVTADAPLAQAIRTHSKLRVLSA